MSGKTKLSIILCSKNDNYCGDSVGRLQTVLNHTGNILKEKGTLEKSEVILSDWGSNKPLEQVLSLNESIKKILRINYIPKEVTDKFPTKFSEVHALNSAAKIARGTYIGRIDQDTLIGERFIDWFFNNNISEDKSYFSTRRDMNEFQSNICKEDTVSFIKNNWETVALNMPEEKADYWKGAVGIFLIPKKIYHHIRGYDETNIYMNHMEHEFCSRLQRVGEFINLGEIINRDFYHIDHPRFTSVTPRRTNLFLTDKELSKIKLIPNEENWGECANYKKLKRVLFYRNIIMVYRDLISIPSKYIVNLIRYIKNYSYGLEYKNPLFKIIRKLFFIKLNLTKNKYSTSKQFISGDNFRSLADHIYDKDSVINLESVKERDIIFVMADLIEKFFKEIHPKIQNKYKLITHNSDKNIGENEIRYIDGKIIHWFAQNVTISHPKITPIPIGIDNMRLFMSGKILVDKFDSLKEGIPNKEPKIFMSFNKNTNIQIREEVEKIIYNYPLIIKPKKWLRPLEYLNTIKKYMFTVSPEGNGIDCHRTWESIYLGTIPIVKRNVSTEYFKKEGAPLFIIDRWNELEELSSDDLKNKHASLKHNLDSSIINFEYWKNKIIKL